jgi:hypothetical protein
VDADLRARVLHQAHVGKFLHGVNDRPGVPGGDLVSAFPVARVVAQVIGAAGQHHGPGGVGQ